MNTDGIRYDMPICTICKIDSVLAKRHPPTCHRCYSKTYKRSKAQCSRCSKIKEHHCKDDSGGYLCDTCYRETKYIPIKKQCMICNNLEIIKKKTDLGLICNKCYVCPIEICFFCNQKKEVCRRYEKHIACRGCYNKIKRREDENFRICTILRSRTYSALRAYSSKGKVKSSDEYGISYAAIIEHLKPFPINSKLYHIDHIIPLCAFDLNDPIQIQAAFAPENHQWLTSTQNMSKNGKYDKEVLRIYLNKFKQKMTS